MINLELYRIFYIVAENKNITKASEVLNISQPAITKHIKNLETMLGTPLFIRTKKGVVLNEYGEKIFLLVKQGLSLLTDAEKQVIDSNKMHIGTIKMGTSTTLVKKYLLPFIEEFHNLYPNIVIDIYTDPTKELISKLKHGTIDFIIGKFTHKFDNDLIYQKLNTTSYIFATNDISLSKKVLNARDLEKYSIILQKTPSNSRESVENYFKENNLNITPTMNIASSNLLVDFISMGYGIGYVTKLYVDEYLKNKKIYELKIKPKPENIDYGIITLKNNIMTSTCNLFIDFVKDRKN